MDEFVDEVMQLPTDSGQWQEIANAFLQKWNFPHTIGALDGKHIACKCPPGSGSTYYNYKKFFSVVLLGLVDADYKFVWVDIGGRGAASDAQVWNDSDLKTALVEGHIQMPRPEPLPHDTQDVPYFIIGKYAIIMSICICLKHRLTL